MLFGILFGFTTKANYLDSTATWYRFDIGVWNGNVTYYFRTIYFDGDTVIGGKTYFKQYELTVDSAILVNPPGPTTVTTYGPRYFRSIREDSNKMFWAFNEWGATEYLSEDFSLGMGDTTLGGCIITNVDSFWFNGAWRKKFLPDWPADYTYAEGIGETRPCGMIYEGAQQLCAFVMNNDTFKNDTTCSIAQYAAPRKVLTGISTLESKNAFELSPNPSSSFTELNTYLKGDLEIYDVLGNKHCQFKVNAGRTRIDTSTFKTGLYFFVMHHTSGRVLTRSLLKIN